MLDYLKHPRVEFLGNILFSECDLQSIYNRVLASIESWFINASDEDVIKVNPRELVDLQLEEYPTAVPILHEDQTSIYAYMRPPKGSILPSSGDRPCFAYAIPFGGDSIFFEIESQRPKPRKSEEQSYEKQAIGIIEYNILYILIVNASSDINNFDSDVPFKYMLNLIKENLELIKGKLKQLIESNYSFARNKIETRRKKLEDALDKVLRSKYKLRRTLEIPDDFPAAERIPVKVKKKKNIASISNKSSENSFYIDSESYEGFLETIQYTMIAMSRNPTVTNDMLEEDLRNILLIPLNGKYEGEATGETFRFDGKTDILVKKEGNDIFVAECKIWRGRKALTRAVDQILNHQLIWSDERTALIIFSRNRSFSKVLNKIPTAIKDHPYFKREIQERGGANFRCIMRHPRDSEKEFTLSVLAVDITTPIES